MKVNIARGQRSQNHAAPDVLHQEHSIISVVSLPRIHGLSLVMKKHWMDPGWGPPCEMYSLIRVRTWEARKEQRTAQGYKRLPKKECFWRESWARKEKETLLGQLLTSDCSPQTGWWPWHHHWLPGWEVCEVVTQEPCPCFLVIVQST